MLDEHFPMRFASMTRRRFSGDGNFAVSRVAQRKTAPAKGPLLIGGKLMVLASIRYIPPHRAGIQSCVVLPPISSGATNERRQSQDKT
jgi:hypothetical protein